MGQPAAKLHLLEFANGALPVMVKRHARARRMTLRLDPEGEGAQLVLPRNASLKEGLAFAQKNEAWLTQRLAALPPRVAFEDGAVIPYLGADHEIVHCPQARRGVWRRDGEIGVSGDECHLARRLTDFLKKEARASIATRVRDKAERLGRVAGRVSLRDTKSRWGSCSAKGDLSFSWRLIFAPESVMDYVVAHEVAHLVEHNHSKRFWDLAASLSDDMPFARSWLSHNGQSLLRYGPASADWAGSTQN